MKVLPQSRPNTALLLLDINNCNNLAPAFEQGPNKIIYLPGQPGDVLPPVLSSAERGGAYDYL